MPNGTPPDDQSIGGSDLIYRRITIRQVKRRGGKIVRAGSNAFDDSSDGTPCSIHIGSKLEENDLEPESILRGYEDRCGIVSLLVDDVRELGYGVLFAPEPGWPAHGFLTGDKTDPRRRKQVAKLARIVVEPPDA